MEYKVRKFIWSIIGAVIFSLVTVGNASAYEAEISKLSAIMAEKIAVTEKSKVAVVDFTDLQGNVTELGRFIAEEFSVSLAGAGKGFKVVDRNHLKAIIQEHKLSATGIIDSETAKKLGKIAGVDALVTGTLTPFGDNVRISIKILDTTTAEVIDANLANIAKTEAIKVLLGNNISSSSDGDHISSDNKGALPPPVEAGGFVFQPKSCKLLNKMIILSFIITNTNKDKELGIRGDNGSKLFDVEGNEYDAVKIQIANSQRENGWLTKRLISGIPTKASISFGGISSNIQGISLLEIHCNGGFRVQFRNVPFSR